MGAAVKIAVLIAAMLGAILGICWLIGNWPRPYAESQTGTIVGFVIVGVFAWLVASDRI